MYVLRLSYIRVARKALAADGMRRLFPVGQSSASLRWARKVPMCENILHIAARDKAIEMPKRKAGHYAAPGYRARGLKQSADRRRFDYGGPLPLREAWVEMRRRGHVMQEWESRPTGAWIEMSLRLRAFCLPGETQRRRWGKLPPPPSCPFL